jgi:hypothetical protein
MKTTKKQKVTAQQQLEQELSKLGMTFEEAQAWLKGGCRGCNKASCEAKPAESDFFTINEACNVVFHPGTTTDTTAVLVDGIPMQGVTKAVLEYDTELGVPILKLEIVGIELPY